MKGFFIEITNNLLELKHRKKMGTAVWEFMWCLDKITKIDEDQIGWVYGGKPIQLKELKAEIGITEPKISKNLNKLKKEGYLILKHTPYGIIIGVEKAQKRFNQKGKPL
jgi:DNA-binding MarR family transcriptional regulator